MDSAPAAVPRETARHPGSGLESLRDLVAHNGYANALVLNAVGQTAAAAADGDIDALLHHVLLANRFWVLSVLAQPFAYSHESRRAASLDELVRRYAETHEQQAAWLTQATETDVARVLESELIPGGRCTVTQAFLQVCLHSHGHRAQLAKLLRHHGAVPPQTDFILWLAGRTAPAWTMP